VDTETPSSAVVELLGEIASALAPALTAATVAGVVFERVLPAIGSKTGALWRISRDGQNLEMVGVEGLVGAFVDPFRTIRADSKLPTAEAVRLRTPIYVHDSAERNTRWPALATSPDGVEALAVLPLMADDRALGCLTLGFPIAHTFGASERRLLRAIAAQCALALDRSLLHESVQLTADRAHVAAEISAVLAEAEEADELPQRVADACVPAFGDWCAVYVADGSMLRRAGVAVKGRPDLTPLLANRFPIPLGADSLIANSYRVGRTQHFPHVTAEHVDVSVPDDEFRDLLRELTVAAGIAIPIWNQDERVGVMTFAMKDDTRSFDIEMISVLEQIADRTGVALSRVETYGRQRLIAEALQRVVLPRTVPSVARHRIAVRYATAGDGDVGGDWWDALVLPDGRVGLSVGDVAGHGLPAAATMSTLRLSMRAYQVDGKTAGAALAACSDLLRYVEPDSMATAIAAAYNPEDRVLSWSNAGHPPPLLAAEGSATFLTRPPAPPLGLATATYAVHAAVLPEHFRLFLYTDGLVEGRSRTLDEGLVRLARVVLTLREDDDLEAQCEQLIALMETTTRDDDVTVVAIDVAP
jgi:GAF domain-containing protein